VRCAPGIISLSRSLSSLSLALSLSLSLSLDRSLPPSLSCTPSLSLTLSLTALSCLQVAADALYVLSMSQCRVSSNSIGEAPGICLRLLIVPLLHGSSRFGSLILSQHSRLTCECNEEEIDDDNEAPGITSPSHLRARTPITKG